MFTTDKVISHFQSSGSKVKKYQDLYVIDGEFFVNVRHKHEASYHRRTKRHEFGIPLVHWNRYVKLLKDGHRVYSVVVETKTDTVYYARLKDLIPMSREYLGDSVDNGGTVFIPKDAYEVSK